MVLGAIILGVATAVLELSIYFKTPQLQKLIRKHEWMGYVISISLAVLLGHVFGATGVMAAIGGTLAMALTQPAYVYINKGHHHVTALLDEARHYWCEGGFKNWILAK